jgi:uncharacterized protein with PIN domain
LHFNTKLVQDFQVTEITQAAPKEADVRCPKCKSSALAASKRGWKASTGMLGSSKVVVTCLNCGWQFSPGQGLKQGQEPATFKDGVIGFLVMFGIGVIAILCLHSCH